MSAIEKPKIVFDLGAVLIDWNPRYLYNLVSDDSSKIEYFLNTVISPAWNHRLDRGEEWEDIRQELVTTHPEEIQWIDLYWNQWEKMLGGAIEESVKILSSLKSKGYKVYALSNFNHHKFSEALAVFPFLGWFDGRVISGEVKLAKPETAIYHYLLKTYKLEAANCLFIDDRMENIEAAKSIGFNTILFTCPQQLVESLKEVGVYV